MLHKVFPLVKPAPLSEIVQSRDAFIYMDRGMRAAGWMYPKNEHWHRIYRLWTLTTLICGLCFVPMAFFGSYFMDLNSFTPAQFINSVQVGLNSCGSVFKVTFILLGIWRFEQANILLDRLDKRCKSDDQRAKVHQTVANCNMVYMYFQILYVLYIISTFLGAVLQGEMAWKFYNPLVNWRESSAKFWTSAFIELFMMSCCVFMQQLADSYPIIYMLIIHGHIITLKMRITQLRSDLELSEPQNYAELVKCIDDHRLIIMYCNNLRPIISGTIFVQFLLIGVSLGISLINLMIFWDIWTGPSTIVYVIGVLAETFPFCFLCNSIMYESEQIGSDLFHSNWINASRCYRKTLLYFIQNAQRPIIFKAGGIFTICLNSNVTVAKLAFSVVTLAKQINLADRFKD